MKKFLLIIGAIFSSYFFCHAQLNNFITYTVHDGLPQSSVFSIIQDQRGYLWLGTEGGGICRFDGKNFTSYTSQDGLSGNIIRSIMEDSDGNIWIGTDNGVTVYDGYTFTILNEKLGLDGVVVLRFLESSSGDIWMATNQAGLFRLNWFGQDSVQFDNLRTLDGLSSNFIFDLYEDEFERLWCGMLGGINVVYEEEDTLLIQPLRLPARMVTSMYEDEQGDLWCGTLGDGLFIFKDITEEGYSERVSISSENGLNDDQIWDIMQDGNKNILIATGNGGVNMYADGEFQYFTETEGLPANEIYCIFEDNERNIWLGTVNNGLVKYLGPHFSHYGVDEGLPEPNIYSITSDGEGNLWLATSGSGLIYMSRENGVESMYQFTTESGLVEDNITAVTMAPDNTLWFSYSENGIGKFDGERFYNYRKENGLISDVIYCLYLDSQNNLWIGTDAGVSNFNKDGFINFDKSKNVADNEIQVITETSRGDVWFGTINGLNRYILDAKPQPIMWSYDEVEGLFHKRIQSLAEDSSGDMWIGTFGGGLYKFDFEHEDSLPIRPVADASIINSNLISSLIFADDKTLIVATDVGFSVLLLDENYDIEKVRNYDETNGFFGIENNINAIDQDVHGNIWFGTVLGITRYNPGQEIIIDQPPILHLTDIRLTFEDVNWTEKGMERKPFFNIPQELSLPYSDNHLTFDFDGISLSNPTKVVYRYYLEGMNTEYSPPTADNYVIYPGISPGSYTFKVIAESGNDNWSDEPLEFSFTIKPPFWQTWWFYTMMVILTGIIIFFYIKWRERKLVEQKRILEQKVQERTAEIREKNKILTEKNDIIEAHNREIQASIRAAKRIQDALLPSELTLSKFVEEYFILFKPRDIVSGDFYWVKQTDQKLIVVAADCTGHGVPGAFMSLLGMSYLNDIVEKEGITDAGQILNNLRQDVIDALHQSAEGEGKEGMDMALCTLDLSGESIQYAGANNPLYLIRDNEVTEVKADRMPVAIYAEIRDFQTHEMPIQKGDCLYMFSDGFPDQFGGPKGKKFKYKPFKELLLKIHREPFEEQKQILDDTLEEWRGDNFQVDDIVIIGIKY